MQADVLTLRGGADEEQLRLNRLIRQLDHEYRETLRLHHWEDLTVREIAVVLDRPTGTIKARLKRGRDRLKALIAAEARAEAPRAGRLSPDDRNGSSRGGAARLRIPPPRLP